MTSAPDYDGDVILCPHHEPSLFSRERMATPQIAAYRVRER
jgi:hypothetical protein